jgi:hypothetical protein
MLLATFLVAGCSESSDQENTTSEDADLLAEMGDQKLYMKDVLMRLPERQLIADSLGAVLRYRDGWIRQQVLAQEARRQGLHESSVFQDAVEEYEQELLAELITDSFLERQQDDEVSREEALRYYEQNRDQFVLSKQYVRFHHMITPDRASAVQARQQLLRGAEWEDVAQRYSVDPSYALRNSRLFHPEDEALLNFPEMKRMLEPIGLTEISPILPENGNYHFIQLLEYKNEGSVPELEWALDHIERAISIEKRREQLNAFEQNLIRQAQGSQLLRLYEPNLSP